jgi:hypothetical protein
MMYPNLLVQESDEDSVNACTPDVVKSSATITFARKHRIVKNGIKFLKSSKKVRAPLMLPSKPMICIHMLLGIKESNSLN